MLLAIDGLVGIMSFTSVTYLVWLVMSVVVYFILPGPLTRSTGLLLISSVFFVLYSPKWFWVILAVTVLAYGTGLILSKLNESESNSRLLYKRLVLTGGVLLVSSGLLVFKYVGFFATIANRIAGMAGVGWQIPILQFAMPIGISFWTFQTVAYVVDVYKGKTKAISNPLYFAASVIFFPIMTMGPITRIDTLVSQLSVKYKFDYEKMQSALLLIGWGFFKKLMIADRLAVFVNTVFDNPRAHSGTVDGLLFFVAAVFFAIQLYTDFSGYSDIARGTARLFGVELPLNFRAPYFARSVSDFWRRWHMTLMDWLKHYIYIPLGGNRKGPVRKQLNILATFFVSGLWHGAGLNYIVWGLLNGGYQVVGQLLAPINNKIIQVLKIDRESFAHKLFQTVLTFVLITIAWVFFRANSVSDAVYMVLRMFVPTVWIFTDDTMVQQGLNYSELMIALLSILVVWVFDFFKTERKIDIYVKLTAQPLWFRWTCYYALILIVLIFGHYGGTYDASDFVYFKF